MGLRETLVRHRKDNRWIFGGLLALLAVLSASYYFIQRGRDLPAEIATDRVLLFVLWYINVVLIITIVYVIARNLFKLLLERRNRILGSRFATKLVFSYIGLSLAPVLLLFIYGTGLLHGWIDRWFDEPAIAKVTTQAKSVVDSLDRHLKDDILQDAGSLLAGLEEVDLGNPRNAPRIESILRSGLQERELGAISVYREADFVHGIVGSQSGLRDLPDPGNRFLFEVLREGRATRYQTLPGGTGRVLIGGVTDGVEPGSRRVVLAAIRLEPELATQTEEILQAFQGYRQLEVRKGDIEATYFLNFLMVTLLILLVASWVGLVLVRRVTVPIRALAEGTRRISMGDLDVRVEASADDDLHILVESFNRMTAELQRNKKLIEESHRELVAANRRLADERAAVGAVLGAVAAGVVSVDPEGVIQTCNTAALRLLRQTEPEVIGRTVAAAWKDSERSKLASMFHTTDDDRAHRTVRLALGGDWKIFEVKVTVMRDSEGGVTGRVMVLEDLTELIHAQQMAAWTDAARRVAHEIKNPLTPIKLAAERALRRYRESPEDFGRTLTDAVETIDREVESMRNMVDEFSRFARMPRPQPAAVDVERLISETIQLYDGIKKGVEVGSHVAPEASRGHFDPEQVRRVLINLLDNAVDALTPPGRIEVRAEQHNGALRLQVADDGPGIPAEAYDKIFLPHFSTKARGTGLGLAIVHRIVSEHHGTVRAEPNEPRGTVFTIDLPQA